jgi:hypothetical protein
MTKPSKNPRRPKRRRSELERLVDLTVLGPTHPELGTGHPLSGENLRIDPRTKARVCRSCVRESQRQFRAAAKRSHPNDQGPPGRPGRPKGGSGRMTELERLLDRTVLERTHPELGTCWLFSGPANPYGRLDKGTERSTHRLGWTWLRGPIPDGMELHHLCGVHACWNPDHLTDLPSMQRSQPASLSRTQSCPGVTCSIMHRPYSPLC